MAKEALTIQAIAAAKSLNTKVLQSLFSIISQLLFIIKF
jgi:hypothetical protein